MTFQAYKLYFVLRFCSVHKLRIFVAHWNVSLKSDSLAVKTKKTARKRWSQIVCGPLLHLLPAYPFYLQSPHLQMGCSMCLWIEGSLGLVCLDSGRFESLVDHLLYHPCLLVQDRWTSYLLVPLCDLSHCRRNHPQGCAHSPCFLCPSLKRSRLTVQVF